MLLYHSRDVEVADDVVAVVKVVMIDVVLIIVGVTARVGGTQNLCDVYYGAATDDVSHLKRHGRDVLQISEEKFIGKTNCFARISWRNPTTHNIFVRTVCIM
jgi:hypothetical protein